MPVVTCARRAALSRSRTTAMVAASSAAPIAIRVICQPGMPPAARVWTGVRPGCVPGSPTPGGGASMAKAAGVAVA